MPFDEFEFTGAPYDSTTSAHEGWRARIKAVCHSEAMTTLLFITIISNLIVTVVATDVKAMTGEVPGWTTPTSAFILACYGLESFARLFAERWRFFREPLNLVELLVLASDCIAIFVSDWWAALLLALRPLRWLRISKSVKVMMNMPELAHMIRGLIGAMKGLIWGAIIVLFVLVVWGVLAVRLMQPLVDDLAQQGVWANAACERCPRAFATTAQSVLTFTQSIVAGDSWGTLSVPLIEAYPASSLFLGSVLFSVHFAILNLLLAVVLDRSNETRQETERELLAFKETQQHKARTDFVAICEQMDQDGSGYLSLDEIVAGFHGNIKFYTTLKLMDIEKEDLWLVFQMLDDDESGVVDYEEFSQQLFRMRSRDLHTMTAFIRFYVSDIWRRCREPVRSQRRTTAAGANARRGSRSEGADSPSSRRRGSPSEGAGAMTLRAASRETIASRGPAFLEPWRLSGPSGRGPRGSKSEEAGPAGAASLRTASKESAACQGSAPIETFKPGQSTWAEKLQDAPPQPAAAEPPQGVALAKGAATGKDAAAGWDVCEALATISTKLEAQTRMLESLPALLERGGLRAELPPPSAGQGPAPIAVDVTYLREGVSEALARISQKLEAQARLLEALPPLTENGSLLLPPGEGADSMESLAASGGSHANAEAGPRRDACGVKDPRRTAPADDDARERRAGSEALEAPEAGAVPDEEAPLRGSLRRREPCTGGGQQAAFSCCRPPREQVQRLR